MKISTGIIFAIIAAVVMSLLAVGVMYVIVQVLRWVVAGLACLFGGGPGTDAGTLPQGCRVPGRRGIEAKGNLPRVCANNKCRHVNRRGARFCAQCGRRL